MAKKRTNISDDTMLIPGIVAEGVIQELAMALEDARGDLPEAAVLFLDSAEQQNDLAEKLSAKAEGVYAANADFARKLNGKGDTGRDTLYAFMRHWASAEVKATLGTAAFDALPDGFANGEEPAPRSAPGMR